MPLTKERAQIGLTTPTPAEKTYLWSKVSIPSAGIGPTGRTGIYTPSSIFSQMHFHEARERAGAGGVRAGKSLATAMEALSWLPHSDLLWFVAADYRMCRQEFIYLMEALLSLGFTEPGLVSFPADRYKPCSLETVWGAKVETQSLAELGKIAAQAPDAVFVCEPGIIPNFEESLQRFRERLTQKRGMLWMAGTFEDSIGEYATLWEVGQTWPNESDLVSFSAPTWENRIIYPGGLNDPEIIRLQNRLKGRFDERCGGIPTPPTSLVFHDRWDFDLHIKDLEYNEDLPIEIAVDPNYGQGRHYSVEFVQWVDAIPIPDVFVIDEVAMTGATHDRVMAVCADRPFWHRIQTGVVDPFAGKSHVFGSASVESIWSSEAGIFLRSKNRVPIENGIERMASYLKDQDGKPHIFFSPKCHRARWEMDHWRRSKNTRKPSEDNCDAIKALCYWLTDRHALSHPKGKKSDWRFDIRELDYEWRP